MVASFASAAAIATIVRVATGSAAISRPTSRSIPSRRRTLLAWVFNLAPADKLPVHRIPGQERDVLSDLRSGKATGS